MPVFIPSAAVQKIKLFGPLAGVRSRRCSNIPAAADLETVQAPARLVKTSSIYSYFAESGQSKQAGSIPAARTKEDSTAAERLLIFSIICGTSASVKLYFITQKIKDLARPRATIPATVPDSRENSKPGLFARLEKFHVQTITQPAAADRFQRYGFLIKNPAQLPGKIPDLFQRYEIKRNCKTVFVHLFAVVVGINPAAGRNSGPGKTGAKQPGQNPTRGGRRDLLLFAVLIIKAQANNRFF